MCIVRDFSRESSDIQERICSGLSGRRRRRYAGGAKKLTIVLILSTFVVIMAIQIANLYQRNKVYAARQQELTKQLEEAAEEQRELEEYEEYTGTREYIEDVAKSKLGLVHENEIVFKESE